MNPYNGYINPYYWIDEHPLLYGNNGSLDPSTPRNHSNPQVLLVYSEDSMVTFYIHQEKHGKTTPWIGRKKLKVGSDYGKCISLGIPLKM